MNQIQLAWEISEKVHKNQKRCNRNPYITHVQEVVNILESMGVDDEDMIIAAILHDVVEDGGLKYAEIIQKEFSDRVISLVHYLTHRKDVSYEVYINGVRSDREATIIKIADMIQNVTENPTKRQRFKYRKALPLLVKSLIVKA